MYKEYYGLEDYPFGITTDTKFLYWSRTHQNAFRHLLYSQQSQKSLIALAGEVGTGKTTLLNAFIDAVQAASRGARIAYVTNSNLHLDDLYRYIFHEFGLEVKTGRKSEYIITLKDFLSTCFERHETPLLILDESQNYSREVLEEIRLLSNLGTPKEHLLQIVLAGQPQLVRNINEPEMYQLKQRINVVYMLHPLNYDEIIDYIHKRLDVAGAKGRALFSEHAIADIYRYSQGIPRVINIICDNTLLYGYAAQRRQIDAPIVKQVAEDMHLRNGRGDETAAKAVAHEAHEGGEGRAGREDAADTIIIQQTRNAFHRKAQNHSKTRDKFEKEHIEIYDEPDVVRKSKSKIAFVWLFRICVLLLCIILGSYFTKSASFEKIQSFVELKSRDFLVFLHKKMDNRMQMDKNQKKSQIISDVISLTNQQDNTTNLEVINTDENSDILSIYNFNDTNQQDNMTNLEVINTDENSGSIKNFTIKKELKNGKDIIVKEGDTFMKILVREYGEYNDDIVALVLEANKEIKEINTILIGQSIHLPAR